MFDKIELEYIACRGWKVNGDGMLELTAKQAKDAPYISRSMRNPDRRTLMITGLHGCTLLFEGQHFIVTGEVRK